MQTTQYHVCRNGVLKTDQLSIKLHQKTIIIVLFMLHVHICPTLKHTKSSSSSSSSSSLYSFNKKLRQAAIQTIKKHQNTYKKQNNEIHIEHMYI